MTSLKTAIAAVVLLTGSVAHAQWRPSTPPWALRGLCGVNRLWQPRTRVYFPPSQVCSPQLPVYAVPGEACDACGCDARCTIGDRAVPPSWPGVGGVVEPRPAPRVPARNYSPLYSGTPDDVWQLPSGYDNRPVAPLPSDRYVPSWRDGRQPSQPLIGRTRYETPVYPEIHWHSDLRDAASVVQRVRRPMILRVTADWCSHCQRMKRETFADRAVIREIADNYVAVNVDADQNKQLLEYASIQTLPTTLVVSPQLRVLARVEGYQNASQLQSVLRRHAAVTTGDSMDVKVASR